MLPSDLKKFGLNGTEVLVYLDLLEHGLSSPPNVSRRTKILRTNCYNVLQELKSKNLVSEQSIGTRKAYVANNPESIISNIEKQRDLAKQLLPDLLGLYSQGVNKPTVRFYNGMEEVKNIYTSSLGANAIYGVEVASSLQMADPDFAQYYAASLKQHSVELHDLVFSNTHETQETAFEVSAGAYYKKQTKLTADAVLPTNIIIWDTSVAFITFGEQTFGTVLTNGKLATTLRTIHTTMWAADG